MSLWNNFNNCLSDKEIKDYKLALDKVTEWLKANQNLKETQVYKDKIKDGENYYELIHNL